MSSESAHQHNAACLELFAKLSEYLDQELEPDTCEKIEQHLKDCPPCRNCLQTLKRTVEFCKSMQNKPVPSELSKRLRSMLEQLR